MKINNCKLCEIYDNQKLSGDDKSSISAQPQFCRHTAATFLSQTQLALAFHLLRGNYFIILFCLSVFCFFSSSSFSTPKKEEEELRETIISSWGINHWGEEKEEKKKTYK